MMRISILAAFLAVFAFVDVADARRFDVRTPRYLGDGKYENPWTGLTFYGERPHRCYRYQCVKFEGCVRVQIC